MHIRTSILSLTKLHPLTISRGTSIGSDNLIVEVDHDGITGLGEMSPFNIGDGEETALGAQSDIERWAPGLESLAPWEVQRIEHVWKSLGGCNSARAALDFAMHDWLGKRAGMPVYQLLGGDREAIVPTSLTVGINPPDVARERTAELLKRLSPRCLKIKLGSPVGIELDKAMFEAVLTVVPSAVSLRVDANGGWNVESARTMMGWLAERAVEYVEQPLPLGQEQDLPAIFKNAPLPIFADESCRVASDIPRLADRVHGINLKLMKAGGIREGLRLIHTARAHGLMVMMGCMSESSLAISASVALSPFADFLDLDSHLNLNPDPFVGLHWTDGKVLPSNSAGLGIYALNM